MAWSRSHKNRNEAFIKAQTKGLCFQVSPSPKHYFYRYFGGFWEQELQRANLVIFLVGFGHFLGTKTGSHWGNNDFLLLRWPEKIHKCEFFRVTSKHACPPCFAIFLAKIAPHSVPLSRKKRACRNNKNQDISEHFCKKSQNSNICSAKVRL